MKGTFDALLSRPVRARRSISPPARARLLWQACFPDPPSYLVIKVAGTNGKGSVCAMLASCLAADGFPTGVFTGPHLSSVTERIRIAEREVSDDALESAARAIAAAIDRVVSEHGEDYAPTYFEALLLVALEVFRAAGVRAVILEAGIGGSYDAVSGIPGALGIVTSIGLDHVEMLGPNEAAIATDKAGIADADSTLVVSATVAGEAESAIETVSRGRGVRIARPRPNRVHAVKFGFGGTDVEVAWGSLTRRLTLTLGGRYQIANLETTLAALDVVAEVMPITVRALDGLERVTWAARFESFPGSPAWLLDGAHNAQGIDALVSSLDDVLPYAERVLLCGMSVGHESDVLAARLRTIAPVRFVADGFYQSADGARVASRVGASVEYLGPADSAVQTLRSRFGASNRTIVVTGSLYLAGDVRSILAAA